jgi:Fur family transcriptional regulator, zinc uptake regulator
LVSTGMMTCDHLGAAQRPDGREVTRAALDAAEKRCAEGDERLTPPRRRVLEMLLESRGPKGAYDLAADFDENRSPSKLVAVYRALEFLQRMGLVHRIETQHAYVACRRGPHFQSAAILICSCCGDAEEVEPNVSPAHDAAEALGFMIHHTLVEAVGLCRSCRD